MKGTTDMRAWQIGVDTIPTDTWNRPVRFMADDGTMRSSMYAYEAGTYRSGEFYVERSDEEGVYYAIEKNDPRITPEQVDAPVEAEVNVSVLDKIKSLVS